MLLLAAVTIGTVELHSDVPHRHSSSERDSSIIILEALHPDLPAHLEASSSGTVRRCNACLLQRSQSYGLLPTPWAVVRLARRAASARPHADLPRSRPNPQRPSRGPPFV
jgi:hypothetical protein